ncbi:hypothetical protein EDD21DRAFT_361988, partial [Dissophora ornata]
MASMNTSHDSFLPTSFDIDNQPADTPWLTTYSRALCSLYPKEDSCWDALLSALPSDFSPSSTQSHRDSATHSRLKRLRNHRHSRSSISAMAASNILASLAPREPVLSPTITQDNDVVDELQLEPKSPGSRLSHTLCKLGFRCIDYFTPLDDEPEQRQSSSHVSSRYQCHAVITPMDSEQTSDMDAINQGDKTADWTAALCGHRTAVLERRRALSRSTSQENGISDPWYEAMDRLSRWDEV